MTQSSVPRIDEFQQRYLDELLASVSILDTIESAAQGEAWASGAIAEWVALGGTAPAIGKLICDDAPDASAVLDWFVGAAAPLERVEYPWAEDLGRWTLDSIVKVSSERADSHIDEMALIVAYSLDGVGDHDLSVTIEQGFLTAATIGPPGLGEGADDVELSGLTVEPIDTEHGIALIRAALERPVGQLSASTEANLPLLMRRFGSGATLATAVHTRSMPARDADEDRWCVEVLRAGLRNELSKPQPDELDAVVSRFDSLVSAHDPDALALLEVAGPRASSAEGVARLIAAVGAYFAPVDLSAHTDDSFDALTTLEPVDWLGVVLGLVRSTRDLPAVDGSVLVTLINRAPEITTSISRTEAPSIAWAFEQMLFAWEVTGVLTEDGRVSAAGRWLLGRAFIEALTGSHP